MTRTSIILSLLAAGPALATPGGQIGTLQQGDYTCELPGDATGPAGIRQDGQSFTVHNSSRYSNAQGRGTYLLTGDTVTMTSGPKKGQRFIRLSDNFLREIDAAGNETNLRCVRRVQNNS
ncbi:MAG: hypothetical protein O9296_01615 [Novosphingobium sp.]|jgi:hypothetical protein|nr:hypothetical protein [Novosphingobium sp.]